MCVCSPQCSPWGEPQNPFFWRLSHCGTLISRLHTSELGSLVFMDSNHAFSMLCQFIKEVEHQFSFCSDFDAQVNFFLPRLHMPSYRWQDDDDDVHEQGNHLFPRTASQSSHQVSLFFPRPVESIRGSGNPPAMVLHVSKLSSLRPSLPSVCLRNTWFAPVPSTSSPDFPPHVLHHNPVSWFQFMQFPFHEFRLDVFHLSVDIKEYRGQVYTISTSSFFNVLMFPSTSVSFHCPATGGMIGTVMPCVDTHTHQHP